MARNQAIADWAKHCKNFLKHTETGSPAEQKAYAAKRGLNYTTFRVRLGKYKKSDTYKRSLAQTQSTARLANGPTSAEKKAKRDKKMGASDKSSPVKSDMDSGSKFTLGVRVPAKNQKVKRSPRNDTPRHEFQQGHSESLVHGKYSKTLYLSPEYQELAYLSLREQTNMLGQQYAMMSITTVSTQDKLKERYLNNDPVKKKVMNREGKIEEITLTHDEALNDVASDSALKMGAVLTVIGNAKSKLATIERDQYKQAAYTPAEIVSHTAEIMAYRDEEKLTAQETCHKFMLMGLVPPNTLVREFEKELSHRVVLPPTAQGITADEVRKIKEEQDIKRAKSTSELNLRRINNENIYAQYTGVGDEDITSREPLTIEGKPENA